MALRTLTFGDLDSGIWGAAWELGEGQGGFALVGTPDGALASGATLTPAWALSDSEVELESVSQGEATQLDAGCDQLVLVRGHVRVAAGEYAVDCLGRRGVRSTLDPDAQGSIRDVAAWFSPEDGLALLSTRPAGAAGHQDDRVTASLFESGHALAVAEPRLSSTYTADGMPIHAGVELWLVHPDADEEPADEAVRYPRRAAGEAASPSATTSTGPLAVQARLFSWHWRGQSGAGVYVLAHRQ
jgi:hypothetical protein